MGERMTHEQRMVFLRYVAECVADDPSLMRDIMGAMTEGLTNKLDQVNQMRVDAEVSVCWLLDKVPKAALAKEPSMTVKAKKVIVNSGMFSGTVHANVIGAEIMDGERLEEEHNKARSEQDKAARAAHNQKLRENRERARHAKKPVATITAQSVARSVATGESKLAPYKVASGKGEWSFHAWVIVVNEEAPSKPQEQSMLYVGAPVQGRDVFASEELALQAIGNIIEHGKSLLQDEKQ
uniref:Uncharacterized protein n=1 Tax=Pseudomonas phage HRDY3 TaxID=3236930 RepID=A0AB39CD98_9VIRU